MKRGLPLEEAAYILNVSKNYVYRLIREEKLEVVGHSPITVSSKSVVRRLISLQPFLEYAVKQHGVRLWVAGSCRVGTKFI